MKITISFLLFIIVGIIVFRLARYIGSEIFKFSKIINFFTKLLTNKS